jgi:hypothetical protein
MQEASMPVNSYPYDGNEPLHGSSRQAWALGKPEAKGELRHRRHPQPSGTMVESR